jgi:Na+/proline symporter/signal transduction histidine kinase
MSLSVVIIASLAYVLLLFLIAFFGARHSEKGGKLVNNPYTYSLSLAVYCTAWTFFGSVGRAAETGIGFLPIYLGPVIFAPIWIIVLRKIIQISKGQRITSIADFISSRYGKSTALGVVASIIAVLGVIPYISIQLKAVALSFETLLSEASKQVIAIGPQTPFYLDLAFYIAIVLAFFTFIFGARKLDPNEKHEGLVAAIAFESLVKIVAFLVVGFFVTYGVFNGFGDIFSKAMERQELAHLFSFESAGLNGWSWMLLIILSMFAIVLLPRQFHIAIVENKKVKYLEKASWLFPAYLLLINIFVLPIAIGGLLTFSDGGVDADTFVLNIPLAYGHEMMALFVYLGGLSAATGMVIVSVTALSIMISNNLVIPFLLKYAMLRGRIVDDVGQRLLGIRRVIIVVVLILSYGYFRSIGLSYSLVSVGLISFTAVAQFAPVLIGGIYWKRATKAGAMSAMVVGFIIWTHTLIVPLLAEQQILSQTIITDGPWGLEFLKPYELFGLQGFDHVSNAAFWSLLFNTAVFIVVSLNTRQDALEITQADYFVDHYKYVQGGGDYEVFKRKARVPDLTSLLQRFLGVKRARKLIKRYETDHGISLKKLNEADSELINYTERHIAGSIGAASAKIIVSSIIREEPIGLEEMLKVLDQTQEIIQYSKELEQKKSQLERTTNQLQLANEQLKELDELKAEFISTVTHELRTPVTSIKAMGKILHDNPDLPPEKKQEFLEIIVDESERISRLVTEVLDLEKVQAGSDNWQFEKIALCEVAEKAYRAVKQLMKQKNYHSEFQKCDQNVMVVGDRDKLTQLIINLLSNAIKFCDPEAGKVYLNLTVSGSQAVIEVADNGHGISPRDQEKVFEKFMQIKTPGIRKPRGTGLGLYICKQIVKAHGGHIKVTSELGKGSVFTVRLPMA